MCTKANRAKPQGSLAVGLYSNAIMHTPIHVTQEALARAKELEVDCCVSVGGGSTIGLGKALALHSPDDNKIKNIVIPTTCKCSARRFEQSPLAKSVWPTADAGSEATPIIGQTENDKEGKPLKTTQKTLKVRLHKWGFRTRVCRRRH